MGILRISNVVERTGTDSAAHGGSDMPEFAKNLLSRIEALAAKAGHADTLEGGESCVPSGVHSMARSMAPSIASDSAPQRCNSPLFGGGRKTMF
ncbi:unnamed protein product [Ectocarpus sp. 12 AP-2014]